MGDVRLFGIRHHGPGSARSLLRALDEWQPEVVLVELPAGRAGAFTAAAAAGHVGVRALGSSALAITQVALGHAVAAVLEGFQEWDVAGALCLAAEAGAVVVDGAGRPDPLPSGRLVVAIPEALPSVLEWWRVS